MAVSDIMAKQFLCIFCSLSNLPPVHSLKARFIHFRTTMKFYCFLLPLFLLLPLVPLSSHHSAFVNFLIPATNFASDDPLCRPKSCLPLALSLSLLASVAVGQRYSRVEGSSNIYFYDRTQICKSCFCQRDQMLK